jgi:hypothetical protein
MTRKVTLFSIVAAFVVTFAASGAHAVTIVNPGFEDTTGQNPFNEFTFGEPVGWNYYDPGGVIASAGTYTGTLEPNGVDFFDTAAPEGAKVAILFNAGREGEGEYGYLQTLADTLQPNTDYVLSVEVGNIASGFATNGEFFNLDEFPGYRVELLAGGIAVAEDDNSLSIAEGAFATSTVSLRIGDSHPRLGENLGIRLVNLNLLPPGYTQQTSPDLEVDFDDVRLSATPIADMPGDVNRDGVVDRADAALLAMHFGTANGAMWSTGDLDADGATTLADAVIVQQYLAVEPTAPAAAAASLAAVPEPHAIAALLSAATALSCIGAAQRKKRRDALRQRSPVGSAGFGCRCGCGRCGC